LGKIDANPPRFFVKFDKIDFGSIFIGRHRALPGESAPTWLAQR
jgi:hypothetical protein